MKLYKLGKSTISQYCLEINREGYYLLLKEKDVNNNVIDFLVHYRKMSEISGLLEQMPMDEKVLRFLFKYVFTLNIEDKLSKESFKEIKMALRGEEY